MASSILYVVQPFRLSEEGDLVAAEPVAAQSSDQAMRMAKRIAPDFAGVIAFARSGDVSVGEYDPATILFQAGEVPDRLE